VDEFHEDHDLLGETPDQTAARHLAGLTVETSLALADDIDAAIALDGDDESRRAVLREGGVLSWSRDPAELFAWLARVGAAARARS
jgi:hypothetical protein